MILSLVRISFGFHTQRTWAAPLHRRSTKEWSLTARTIAFGTRDESSSTSLQQLTPARNFRLQTKLTNKTALSLHGRTLHLSPFEAGIQNHPAINRNLEPWPFTADLSRGELAEITRSKNLDPAGGKRLETPQYHGGSRRRGFGG
jgi:hypothetical protein